MTFADSIYLDNNSTTVLDPRVADAIAACMAAGFVNPASQHELGRHARRELEQARDSIARVLGVETALPHADQVIITSGGTEANNLAIRGLVAQPGHVLISAIEHPSALAAADELASTGCEIELLPVTPTGHVEANEVATRLRDDTRLVCVMLGNNETGTLQPISEIARLCLEKQIPMHTDGVQAVGKISLDFHELGVSSLSISAHKFHGPPGVGALLLRTGVTLRPLLVGGSQQLGLRPGTEPIAGVVGMARALELFASEQASRRDRMVQLRDALEASLLANCQPAVINGLEPRLPHTTNISFPGIDCQALVMALDFAGVACSTGSACTSGSSEPSQVLLAMGLAKDSIESSIRMSVSAFTKKTDIASAADRIASVVNDLRTRK